MAGPSAAMTSLSWNAMPTYTVHEPPPRQRRSDDRSGALRVRARRIPCLGILAGAALAAARTGCGWPSSFMSSAMACSARLSFVRVPAKRAIAAGLAIALLVGFEASASGAGHSGAAGPHSASWSAKTLKTAERRFFSNWAKPAAEAPASPPASPAPGYSTPGAADRHRRPT